MGLGLSSLMLAFCVYSYVTYSNIDLSFAILISALILSNSPLGQVGLSFLIAFIALIFVVNKTMITKERFLFLMIAISFIGTIMFFSFEYNSRYVNYVGKFTKTLLLLSPILFIRKFKINDETDCVKSFISTTIFLQIVGAFVWLIFGFSDTGIYSIPRFSGIGVDANYTAFLYVILLYISLRHELGNKFVTICLFGIILSQAVTAFICGLTIMLLVNIDKYNMVWTKRFTLLALVVSIFSYISFIKNPISVEVNDNWESSYIAKKTNSLIFRLKPQIESFYVLKQYDREYIGFGSGQSKQFFTRVFHNSYTQMNFDHGVIVATTITIIVIFFSYFSIHWVIMLIMLGSSLMFDHFFMMTIPLSSFISYKYEV